jgi:RHS repeat-associated protein
MAYADPDAVTQIANGLSSTTYAYDNNGNLISAGTGAATTTYTYDYANRLTAPFSLGATTTYGYDAFGARVYQIVATTSTSTYPFKFFSIASTTKSSTNYATSTEYVFNGDTLLSTVDQKLVNGAASGTAAVRYVHPDHLGSTNVVTDQNQNLVQTLDYYPYGATRISVSTSTNEMRRYIGQFTDTSGLLYLQARYMDPTRGQFLSQDPRFLSVGNPDQVKQVTGRDQQTFLADPQLASSYNYGRDNPITNKDPNGNAAVLAGASLLWPMIGATISSPEIMIPGAVLGLAVSATTYAGYRDIQQKTQNYNNKRSGGMKFVPFGQQGREVMPPHFDPDDPWGGNITGGVIIGAATIAAAELVKQVQESPSNRIVPTDKWTPLPPINIQGSSQQNKNAGSPSSASYNAQIASIQAQINQIQAQVNAIAQSRARTSR